ncbi:membrane protein insertion efficiency factor YidD, partial [Escherichia coli]|nr:membrane protein insertion efficiency factor YidD [Escherichia coli]
MESLIMKKIFLAMIHFYQRFISRITTP